MRAFRPLLVSPFALVAAALIGSSASAQQMTAEGAARTASVTSAIVQFCPAYYIVDGPKAVKMSSASREMALKWSPPGKGQAMVDAEFERRFQEVQATGPSHWCQNIREVHRNLKTHLFLN
ncbi:hypothetical protein [Methylobacterium sp. OT2]|uniref:hypothetical protein n=1 Tax=Methylobacterium sp. OT2 TaxID=2813779 RepID=UPI00197BEED9|nr:hypothetical protein [Methylobacterium sp. OT2]MBN4095654.1 hypothetical protein [Methylobacterium sp. OT2]